MAKKKQQQYSDLPQGAVVYDDLPAGATVAEPSTRPAGLPAGVDLPGVPAAPLPGGITGTGPSPITCSVNRN